MGLLDRIFRRSARPQHVRSYDGAAAGRRTSGAGVFGRVNAEIGAAGQTLASRFAYLVENNAYIRTGVENSVAEIVGSGIRPVPRGPNAARLVERFERWNETADADGRQDFYGLQLTIVRQVIVSGESPVLFVEDGDGFRLRLLPADQIDWSITRNGGDGVVDVQGVRLSADGRRIGYWVRPSRETDPWDTYAPPILVSAEDIAHVFKPTMPGQVHGVPWGASIILAASEFDKLTDALAMGAATAAMFCGVVTNENEIGGDDAFDDTQSLEPGALIRLKGGQRVNFSAPAQANETSAFVKQQIRGLAAGLGVPAFMMDGDVSQANYSSMRAALLPFRRRVEAFQYGVLTHQLLNPIWRRFVASEVLSGNLDPEDAATRVDWIMPRPLQVDPQKDVQALRDMIDAGLMSRREAVNQLGWSVEELDAEIKADRDREAALGLNFGKESADGGNP
jgi:lambda family phage portal protein